jgi:hypothetical protein
VTAPGFRAGRHCPAIRKIKRHLELTSLYLGKEYDGTILASEFQEIPSNSVVNSLAVTSRQLSAYDLFCFLTSSMAMSRNVKFARWGSVKFRVWLPRRLVKIAAAFGRTVRTYRT